MKTRILLVVVTAIALFTACKGKSSKGEYEFINNHKSSLSGADSAEADTAKLITKLVKTAQINFKVKNVLQTSEDIAALTKVYGGIVMHHKTQSSAIQSRDVHISNDSLMRIASYSTSSEMVVKIPSDKLEDFFIKVDRMGIYVNTSIMDIEDKTLDYLSSRLKLQDRRELVNQQKQGKIKIKNSNDLLSLKDDMVDQHIENLRTDDAVKFSTVNLNFYQSDVILKETIANDDPSAYNIPVFQRIGLALASGWSVFVDLLIGIINLWAFIMLGFVIWAAYRYYRKRPRLIDRPSV